MDHVRCEQLVSDVLAPGPDVWGEAGGLRLAENVVINLSKPRFVSATRRR